MLAGKFTVDQRADADPLACHYLGRRKDDDLRVSLRIVHRHFARSRSFAHAFSDTMPSCLGLDSPGIVRVLDVGHVELADRTALFVVHELFEGRSLSSVLRASDELPLHACLTLGMQILEALGDAHCFGLAHMGLSPDNVIVGSSIDGRVRAKLIDFVLARLCVQHAPLRLTSSAPMLGTPCYAAPEVVAGAAPHDRSDLYSAGVVLYEMLTGRLPFEASSRFELERLILKQRAPSLHERAPQRGISPALETVVLRALEKDSSKRYPSVAAMRSALEAARSSLAPSSDIVSLSPRRRRPLFGRADMVDHVLAAAQAAWEPGPPSGCVALVMGGAGMGKTAVVDEVIDRLRGGPLTVLTVVGRRATARPLEPFTELVRDVLGLRPGAPEPEVELVGSQLQARFQLAPDDVVRVLDRVMNRPSSLQVEAEVVEREQLSALRVLVARLLAPWPTVLVIQDADVLDPSSRELVKDLMEAASCRALSVIATARSEPWPDWDAPHVHREFVASLDEVDSEQLLRSYLDGKDVANEVVALAVEWAKGAPLVLELIALAMRRREPLVRDGQLCLPSTSQALYGGLRELVAIALRASGTDARRWLSMAALVGSRAPLRLLEAWQSAELTREELLDGCLNTGLVHHDGTYLEYWTEGVREVVRTLIPQAERQQMHRFVAAWLTEHDGDHLAGEAIAGHFEACGEFKEAAELVEREAVQLLARGEARAAAALFAWSFRLWQQAGRDPAAKRVAALQIEAHLRAGDGTSASEAMGQLERLGPVYSQGLRARVFAALATAQRDPELAIAALRRASDAAVDSLDQGCWYEVENRLAEIYLERLELQNAERHAVMAHELARSICDAGGEARTLADSGRVSQAASFVARIRTALGKEPEARAVLQAALDQAALMGDEASAARVLANMAHLHASSDDHAAALQLALRALEYALRVGDRAAGARIAINVGTYRIKQGLFEDARKSFLQALALSTAVGWSKGKQIASIILDDLRRKRAATPRPTV